MIQLKLRDSADSFEWFDLLIISQIESPNNCSVAELERQIDKLTKVCFSRILFWNWLDWLQM